MNSVRDESSSKYQEVSPFQMSEGFTRKMEPVKTGRIFLAAVAASLSAFSAGTCLGWSSPVAPKLKSPDTSDSPLSRPITTDEDAWISSLITLGAIFAPFIAGPLTDRFGRKWLLLSSALFFAASFVINLNAHEVWQLYVARLLQGCGVGFGITVQPMYLSEIATDNVRGSLGSMVQLFVVSGILYVYAIGPYVSYFTLQWCCLAVPVVFVISFVCMPDTPHFYAARDRKEDAIRSLMFLRNQSSADSVADELAAITSFVATSAESRGNPLDLLRVQVNRRALFISAGLIIFQQLTGSTVVLFNVQSIFASANLGVDAAVASIIIGSVQVAGAALTPFIADRLGRRLILLASACTLSLTLALFGGFFYMQQVVRNTTHLLWLPIPTLVVYQIGYCSGFGPMSWAMLGELFAPNIKAIAAPIVVSTCWTVGFIVTRWYPALDALGSYYVFWLFGAFCALAVLFIACFVIETKGLSLPQIQDRLKGQKNPTDLAS